MIRWFLVHAALASLVSAAGPITLDGSLGPAGALAGPNYTIPAAVGRTRGNNLFHSFGQFDLNAGESATFTGPAAIQNIIARVTGGSASTIDGAIDTTAMPGANFFFINPFGVIIGPNAQLNVGGAFTATTADYVKLADGGRFDARNPANDILTTAPVSAFGFLGPTVAPISVNGAGLTTVPGQSFSVIGGDIEIIGSHIVTGGGRVNCIGAGSAGELAFDVTDSAAAANTDGFAQLGDVVISDGAYLETTGVGAGGILIAGENITLANYAFLEARTTGATAGGLVEINARAALQILDSAIVASSADTGRASDIQLTARSILLDGQGEAAEVSIGTAGLGAPGNITVKAESLTLVNGAALVAGGGDINIQADTVRLDGMDLIASINCIGGDTPAGTVTIIAHSLSLANEAVITAQTAGSANGGAISIHVDSLELNRNAVITASTRGGGNAGLIDITANTVTLDGAGQSGSSPIGITAESIQGATGRGGDIILRVGTLNIRNGAEISTASLDAGHAGDIEIHADEISLSHHSTIRSFAGGAGDAGNLLLAIAGELQLADGGDLSTFAATSAGGNITVQAGGDIILDNGRITASANGDGGNIQLTTPSLLYLLDSQVTAHSESGNGGNVTIDPILTVLNHSTILASAIFGNGGNIDIVTKYFLAGDSVVDASSQFGLQGTVRITSPQVDLSGDLVPLMANPLEAESRLKPHCSVRLPGGVSSFTVAGRGGWPIEPDSLMPVFPSPR